MKSYPKLLRLAVLRESDAGMHTSQVAKRFDCSRAWVRRVKQQRRELGKRGPYTTRRRDRSTAALKDQIKYAIIEEPALTVEEVQRIFRTELSAGQVVGIRDELFVNNDTYWRGADRFLPPGWLCNVADSVQCQILRGDLFKKQVRELLIWKPEIAADELERILGAPPDFELIAELRESIEIKQALRARDEKLRQPPPAIEPWDPIHAARASHAMYPSL